MNDGNEGPFFTTSVGLPNKEFVRTPLLPLGHMLMLCTAHTNKQLLHVVILQMLERQHYAFPIIFMCIHKVFLKGEGGG